MSASLVGSEMCIRDRPPASASNDAVRSAQRAVDRLVESVVEGGAPVVDQMMKHVDAASASHGGA
eukprot:4966885-Alexandrium_andersonii.AAC.1